jgi:hypothetical protein
MKNITKETKVAIETQRRELELYNLGYARMREERKRNAKCSKDFEDYLSEKEQKEYEDCCTITLTEPYKSILRRIEIKSLDEEMDKIGCKIPCNGFINALMISQKHGLL